MKEVLLLTLMEGKCKWDLRAWKSNSKQSCKLVIKSENIKQH